MIPPTFDKAKDFIEAMEFREVEGMTKADWERDGYMAILSRLTIPGDFLAAILQIPMCQRLPFVLEACLAIGKEVEPLMPRPAKAVFQDLILNPNLMDNKARREALWQRITKTLRLGFREDQNLPLLPTHARGAGTVAYQATLIYCTPFIPLQEAHKALGICLQAGVAAQVENEGGNTILSKLLPLAQREYGDYLAADLKRARMPKEVKL